MMRIWVAWILVVMSASAEAASGSYFLELNPDTRTSALGGAGELMHAGPLAVWSNPAIHTNPGLAFTWKKWIEDERDMAIAWTTYARDFSLSLSAFTSSIDDVPIIEGPDGVSTGSLSENDLILGATLGWHGSSLFQLGMTAKYLYEEIYTENATGGAVDFGGRIDLPGFRLGMSVANIGKMTVLENEASELPLTYRLSAGTELDMANLKLGLHGLAAQVRGRDATLGLGTEWSLRKRFHMRFGYLIGHESTRYSFGVGARVRNWMFDWTYQPLLNDLGNATQITITYGVERTW